MKELLRSLHILFWTYVTFSLVCTIFAVINIVNHQLFNGGILSTASIVLGTTSIRLNLAIKKFESMKL